MPSVIHGVVNKIYLSLKPTFLSIENLCLEIYISSNLIQKHQHGIFVCQLFRVKEPEKKLAKNNFNWVENKLQRRVKI